MGMIFFIPIEIMSTSEVYDIEIKGVLERPMYFTKTIISTRHRISQKKYVKAWRLLFAVIVNLSVC